MSAPNSNSNFLSRSQQANSPGAATSPSHQKCTRTLHVNISGSLEELASRGPLAGLWKPVNGKESVVFHPTLDENINVEQNNNIINSLRSAIVTKVTLKEHRSTFPFTLGVTMNFVQPNEVTDLGEKFAYTILPHSVVSAPQVIHLSDQCTQDSSAWQKLYAAWNASNLETHGVVDLPNQSFLFVHIDHPVIGLLRYNQNLIGCDIDSHARLEKEYLKVSKQVMSTCCDTIKTDVLSKLKSRDLNCCALQLRRLNNTPWDEMDQKSLAGVKLDAHMTPEEKSAAQHEHLRSYLTTPYEYTARLEIEYEIPIATNIA